MDLSNLSAVFGNSAFTVVVFIIALSIIVTVHEYGHYIVGKWCGIKADVFSLGFGKPLVQRTAKDGTVWQIAAIPLGGYVKFAGDANAASAPDAHAVDGMAPDEARHTMPGAPLWARTLTVAAGPVFNFIFSALVFAGLSLSTGQVKDTLEIAQVKPVPFEVGLQSGDTIVAIGGVAVPELSQMGTFIETLPRTAQMDYTVERGGAQVVVTGPHPFPVIVGGITPKSAARDARLDVGDVITTIDGVTLNSFYELRDAVAAAEGREMTLTVWRDGETFDSTMTARRRDIPADDGGFETRWLIGIYGSTLYTQATDPVGIGEALVHGVEGVWSVITGSLSGLYNMVERNISACNLTGAVGMAGAVSTMASQGIDSYISVIAFLSTAIGLINLFPIPVLDGGHLVFYAYEAVRGKPLPDRAVGIMMGLGLVVVLFFMSMGLAADFLCK
ncbi:RIP metalloprotease RseP [Celeribacter marinus]|uniref:RIP metalloprotease RseP n=1 Tax=Celeribacter marinus TaxID=1397108 RepID=UPI00316FA32C